jgi:hypothetical protein
MFNNFRKMYKKARSISKIRIEFHYVKQCFSNKIKPLHVLANHGHHQKATSTSGEMLHIYYMHGVSYGLH